MKRRLASPENDWQNFTDDHRELRKELLDAIQDIDDNQERDPIALVGPYRTGKTQLLYEAFDGAWENGIPALYTDANTIFNEFDKKDNTNISEWLSNRTSEQVNKLADGEVVDWLPHWNHVQQKETYARDIATKIDEEQTAILLVDEIEQAYTRIREADFVDDDNPLRVLLDEPDGVYQVWAFGLVAAYELGPADYARFQELRVPVLDVDDIREQLHDRRPNVNEEIAPGIWWLSRGRIGWANKLVDEAPESSINTAKWVREISTREFEGLTPINNEVWTEGVPSTEWDSARRSIMFIADEYDTWERRDSDVIRAEDAVGLLLEFILELTNDLSPDAKQLLEENIERLVRNIIPVSSRADGDLLIPGPAFTDKSMLEGFIDLLSDLLLSFEASTEDRAQLINALEELDIAALESKWTNEFYNNFVENPSSDAWLPDLSVVNDAYPPVAVDPSRLTEETTEELRNQLVEGISIDPEVSTRSTQYEVVFCPTEEILEEHLEDVLTPTEFSKVYVFFAPEGVDDEFESERLTKLSELHRVNIVPSPETRLWKFVIHLQHYLESEYEVTGQIRGADVRDVLADEQVRDKRNVISSLFSQLNEIAKSETLNAVRSFENQFTRADGDQLLWQEPLAGETGPDVTAPGVYGARSERLNALAFSIGVTRFDLNEYSEIASIVATLENGLEEDFVGISGNEFGYGQFIDSTLTRTGVTRDLESFWRKFRHEESGQRDQSITNLQNLLMTLLELSDTSMKDIIYSVKSTINSENRKDSQLAPVKNSTLDTNLQRDFILGVVLEEIVVQQHEQLSEIFDKPGERLSNGRQQLARVENEVETLNQKLVPPNDYGQSVEIIASPISNRKRHLETLSENVSDLNKYTNEFKNFGGVAVSYYSILDAYLDLYEEQIKSLRKTIVGAELFSVQDLKGTFSQVKKLVEQDQKFFEFTEYSQEEAINEINSFAAQAFDFEAAQGGGKVNPLKEDALKNIESHAEESEAKVREFNQKIRQLKREIESMETKQAKLQDSIAEFERHIQSEGGDQQ